jgi:serine/threonine protein kinase/WD40 repeat protein
MPDDSVVLGRLADEFTARLRAGELPEIEGYARDHPNLAERIRGLFPTLLLLEGMAGGGLSPGLHEAQTAPPGPFAAGLTPELTFNHYRIVREVGRGGMGIVYEAVHQALDKRVALKVLPVFADRGSSQLERFLREARTAAGLHHTNIVPVFDIGQASSMPYYAMQYIEGRGLDWVLRDLEGDKEVVWPAAITATELGTQLTRPSDLVAAGRARAPAFFRMIAELGIQAAEALAYAHQRGVIHRDIKPSNLLLDEQGVLWITDFGLARRGDDPVLTHSGALLGTPRYMSPEQAEAARRPVDHRTDIYSLGATLYELVTRRPAFTGATPQEVVLQILDREPVPPRRLEPSVPRDLETIVQKAMAKRPVDRYQSAADLALDLGRWLRLEPIRARRIGAVGRTIRWGRRNPALATLTALVVALAAVGFAGVAWQWREAEQLRHAAEEDRDRARAAEEQAAGLQRLAEARLVTATAEQERAQDHLARSKYEQARALRASGRVGRRWQILDLVREAEQLRARPRQGPALLADAPTVLPSRTELRSEAVAALLLPDARELWRAPQEVFVNALSPDGRLVATFWAGETPGQRAIWLFSALARILATLSDRSSEKGGAWLLDAVGQRTAGKWPWPEFAKRLDELAEVKVALSPDGKWLATAHNGLWPRVEIRELATGRLQRTLSWPGERVPGQAPRPSEEDEVSVGFLDFSPDGQSLLALATPPFESVGADTILWELRTGRGRVLSRTTGPERRDRFFAEHGARLFSPGARYVVYRSGPKRVSVRDRQKEMPACEVEFPWLMEGQASFGRDDHTLLAVCRPPSGGARVVVFWDLARKAEAGRIDTGLRQPLQAPALSPDGTRLAVAGETETVYVFDVATEKELCRLEVGHGKDVGIEVYWQADSRHLLTATKFGPVQRWEIALDGPRSVLATGLNEVSTFAFSPDGKWLAVSALEFHDATSTWNGTVKLLDRATGRLTCTFSAPASDLRFRNDSQQLLAFGGQEVTLRDMPTGKELIRRKAADLAGDGAGPPLVRAAAFTPTGRVLVAVTRGLAGSTRMLDLVTGQELWRTPSTGQSIAGESIYGFLSPGGQLLVGVPMPDADLDRLRTWSLPQGKEVPLLQGLQQEDGFFYNQFWSPDGRWLALHIDAMPPLGRMLSSLSLKDPHLAVWSLPSGKKCWEQQLGDSPGAAALSPTGGMLAVAFRDGTVQLRRLDDGQEIFRWVSPWKGLEDARRLAFTPDGSTLAAGGVGEPNLRLLHLAELRRELERLGLGW